jgi:hypothetical protein
LIQTKLDHCRKSVPQVVVILDKLPYSAIGSESPDFTILIGKPKDDINNYAAQLGDEEIVLITHPDVSIDRLSSSEVQEIFSFHTKFDEIWIYPESHELQVLFEEVVMDDEKISVDAKIAPNPGEMLSAVSASPEAIGYIPKSWINSSVNILPVEASLEETLKLPVLAWSQNEPQGETAKILACLQKAGSLE